MSARIFYEDFWVIGDHKYAHLNCVSFISGMVFMVVQLCDVMHDFQVLTLRASKLCMNKEALESNELNEMTV